MLVPAQPGFAGIALETALRGRTILSEISDGSDKHLVLTDHGRLQRLTILSADTPGGHHFLILPDRCWASRLAALDRFAGKSALGLTDSLNPTAAQRRRLILMLNALDYLQAADLPKPTLRSIAETVLYPRHDLGRAIEWKCSPQRRQTQRLVCGARHLVEKGYRELLKGRISRPEDTSPIVAIKSQSPAGSY